MWWRRHCWVYSTAAQGVLCASQCFVHTYSFSHLCELGSLPTSTTDMQIVTGTYTDTCRVRNNCKNVMILSYSCVYSYTTQSLCIPHFNPIKCIVTVVCTVHMCYTVLYTGIPAEVPCWSTCWSTGQVRHSTCRVQHCWPAVSFHTGWYVVLPTCHWCSFPPQTLRRCGIETGQK